VTWLTRPLPTSPSFDFSGLLKALPAVGMYASTSTQVSWAWQGGSIQDLAKGPMHWAMLVDDTPFTVLYDARIMKECNVLFSSILFNRTLFSRYIGEAGTQTYK